MTNIMQIAKEWFNSKPEGTGADSKFMLCEKYLGSGLNYPNQVSDDDIRAMYIGENDLIDWQEEMQKCIDSPYYFATKYLTVNNKPFETGLTEEEFNREFKMLSNK